MKVDPREVRIPCPVCESRPMVYERKAHILDGRLAAGHLMRCHKCGSRVVIVPAAGERSQPKEA